MATMPRHSLDQAIRTDRAACGAQKACAQCNVGVKPPRRHTKARSNWPNLRALELLLERVALGSSIFR